MQLSELFDIAAPRAALDAIGTRWKDACTRPADCRHFLLDGLHASARAVAVKTLKDLLADQASPASVPFVIVMDNRDEAQYMYADLQVLYEDSAQGQHSTAVLFFPTSRRKRQSTDEAMVIQRTEVLAALAAGTNTVVVTYPEALSEPVPPKDTLRTNTTHIRKGDTMAVSDLAERLAELGFERVDFVYEPGQFAVRGGIVDIYSYSHEDPYRLDFFGDEVDSIRMFDIENQLSKNKTEAMQVVGPSGQGKEGVADSFLTDYLAKDTLWISNDWALVKFKTDGLSAPDLTAGLTDRFTVETGGKSFFPSYSRITFQTLPQPVFHKRFDLLYQDLRDKQADGYTFYILSDQKKQTDRLAAIFEGMEEDGDPSGSRPRETDAHDRFFIPVSRTLHAGFIDKERKIACYTDHEIFERYHRVMLMSENARRGKAVVTLKEINQMQPGDYVVHSDHGIGQFGGLVTTTVNGRQQEMIKLVYRGGDTIFVSIHNLHRIAKYKGKEGVVPTVSKIGSGAWERLKERTKDKVKEIARDLIKLYATRKGQSGFAYTPDGYMQHELEASFLYEDTPDQAKATLDVKRDMENPRPMDRLICGDVGFGKTEVAMRAAFKAATDGKQVAVLVPTTVLALQHYNTFKERFADFPVTIEYLSRAKSAKETKEVLQRLKEGKIDILIGTHKLVGNQVTWHDLGLLIIDEEQKFGVAVKEKIKVLRTNIDVLTMTATPIPRTLQFSLLGARDLSIINTPPPNRYPVQTETIGLEDEDIVKEAIDLELGRNGQVFAVSNRIESLPRIANRLQRLCPEARIVIAHGQMPSDEMEEKLEAFINYDYDILVSTTIIESGVDIPNVNTILVFSAQHYGLADLHQLRGRVGRSNRKAYCYLITPDRELLTPEARRRLDAIATFAELGSGFNLAMQDLDIRGAGNMLGAEQSGFIAELGYATYQRILNEAVEELKEEMHLDAENEDTSSHSLSSITPLSHSQWCSDCQLESDLPLCFPSSYIENISERIMLYRELDGLGSEEEMSAYTRRLVDRFGALPNEAEELLNVVRLRWLCCRMGIEKIFLKGEQMTLYLATRQPSYSQSNVFGKIVTYVYTRGNRCKMSDEKGIGKVSIQDVKTVSGAIHLLNKILAI